MNITWTITNSEGVDYDLYTLERLSDNYEHRLDYRYF